MTCARAGAAPSLGLVPPLGSLRLRGLFPRCDRSRPGSLLRLGACPRLGLVPAWGHSLSGPLPSGAAPAGAAPAWGPLPLWAAPAQGCSRLGGAPSPGLLPRSGLFSRLGPLPRWGRSVSGGAPAWGPLHPPGSFPPGVAPSPGALPARWAGRVSIVDPPSVPSCIIIITQVHFPPVLTFSDIF